MDPALPTQLLVGHEDLSHLGGTAGFNVSSQRFHHILHLAVSSGEQEKLAQVEQPRGHPGPFLCCVGLEQSSEGCSKSQQRAPTGPSAQPRAISNPALASRVCTTIS